MTDSFELVIQRLGIYGEGVGYYQGYTVFVDQALPGEKVLASFYEKRKSFGRAKLIKILEASSSRITPICPSFGRCGGCQLLHFSYSEQLKAKKERVRDALERIGKLENFTLKECIASPHPLYYRNKIQLPYQRGRLGLYAFHSHDLVEIQECHIHSKLGGKVLKVVRSILEDKVHPEIKSILIKSAAQSQEALVVIVTTSRSSLELFAERILSEVKEVKGVVQNIQPHETNTILGDTFYLVAGRDYIHDSLLGLTFRVSPASFFQVNPLQAEQLYLKALEFCEFKGSELFLDAYCGVGTFALIAAPFVKSVIGLECVEAAIADARINQKMNNITNVSFKLGKTEELIGSIRPDVALLNPPRKGCDSKCIEALLKHLPETLVYISCDPGTLARDAALLTSYQLLEVQPFDMFPQTAHVECVAKFRLKG